MSYQLDPFKPTWYKLAHDIGPIVLMLLALVGAGFCVWYFAKDLPEAERKVAGYWILGFAAYWSIAGKLDDIRHELQQLNEKK
ncbi:MAG: hypothetical protein KGH64_04250 [Candidatus Micrarchaeota archaeon]|nr:hypothetical protein [Candidatus Micrarchaeota archaeon]